MSADYGTWGFGDPDFVLLGVALNTGGVMLVASDTLTSAEITQQVDRIDVTCFGEGPQRRFVDGRRWCELHAEMHDLVIVHADTYAEAFANLFRQWTPRTTAPKKLAPGRLAELVEGRKEIGR